MNVEKLYKWAFGLDEYKPLNYVQYLQLFDHMHPNTLSPSVASDLNMMKIGYLYSIYETTTTKKEYLKKWHQDNPLKKREYFKRHYYKEKKNDE